MPVLDPAVSTTSVPVLQSAGLDVATLLELPAHLRAAVSFVLTVAFGGAVIYRHGGRIDAAVASSRESPLHSIVYGLIAYGLVGFFVFYAYSQLLQLGVGTSVVTGLALVVLGGILFSLGGFGFVVVGAWLTGTFGVGDPWVGLVGVGLVSAVAWLVLPVLLGLLVWVAIAAVGIGGPTRSWMHAEAVEADPG